MCRNFKKLIGFMMLLNMVAISAYSRERYKNFDAAIYARVYEVQKMGDLKWLDQRFSIMERHLKVSKIYLETHRDMVVVDEETLQKVKSYFQKRGIKTSGGITITVDEGNRFETYCYTNPEHRKKLKEVVEFTARHFDEIILDDFFFTSCKCRSCIAAKGEKSWTRFRLDLMDEAARELVLKPARTVNPKVKVIIKYPNWYEHFQGLGFNLETEPQIFDAIYTGTETRDAVLSNQHLQPYLGYQIFRYFENLKPGNNAGGWVDTGGLRHMDRYAEQLWLTLFAKAPEITLFDFRQMENPINVNLRADWQGTGTSFDFDKMIAPVKKDDGSLPRETATMALAAGYALEQVDQFVAKLGKPVGVPGYRPFHATGEDFLHNYLGMVGIPIDLRPEFPKDAPLVLLTESAKFDASIVEKIKTNLLDNKTVVITSGLLRALQGKGIEDIVELEYTDRKALVQDFKAGWGRPVRIDKKILIPQIQYLTNDSWEEVSALDGPNGWPILHMAGYAGSALYVLTIPDNFADLYYYPLEVLNRIKQTVTKDLYVRVEAPAQVALFVYDNQTFIVESFLDEPADIKIVSEPEIKILLNLETGDEFTGKDIKPMEWRGRKFGEEKTSFELAIKPHSYFVFQGLKR